MAPIGREVARIFRNRRDEEPLKKTRLLSDDALCNQNGKRGKIYLKHANDIGVENYFEKQLTIFANSMENGIVTAIAIRKVV